MLLMAETLHEVVRLNSIVVLHARHLQIALKIILARGNEQLECPTATVAS